MTSLLIVTLTMCITRFDQWDTFNEVTHQNIPRNRTGVVAEILCIAGSMCGESGGGGGSPLEIQKHGLFSDFEKNNHWVGGGLESENWHISPSPSVIYIYIFFWGGGGGVGA